MTLTSMAFGGIERASDDDHRSRPVRFLARRMSGQVGRMSSDASFGDVAPLVRNSRQCLWRGLGLGLIVMF